ncbi:MAG TPA: hypothetical protein VME70_08830 [Mycobacteriales bacterium]|nr:hypothetical protein [Mycobacteriales bacterium]
MCAEIHLMAPDAEVDYEGAWRALADACPGFASSEESLAVDEDDGRYIWVAALVRYLVRRLSEGDTTELARACVAVEGILADGGRDERNLANVGFIEDITNANIHDRSTTPHDLLPFFGPLALHNEWLLNIEHGYNYQGGR